MTNAGQGKVSAALRVFETWARQLGLLPTEIRYLARTRDHRELRCTSTGAPGLERAHRTIWLSPALTDGQRARLIEQVNRPPDLVAISPLRYDWPCSACGGTGSFLIMEDGGPKCLACTGLDRLVYLPRGDATLTRRALAASAVSAIVVRFSRARRRYERVGVLVEADALTAAADRERGS